MDEQKIAQNLQALKTRLRGRGGRRVSGRGGSLRFDSGSGRDSHPGSESVSPFVLFFVERILSRLSNSSDAPAAAVKKRKTKVGRKWGDEAPTEGDMASLDYSSDRPDGKNPASPSKVNVSALVDRASFGTRTADGMYEVKDWEFGEKSGKADEMDKFISQALDSVSLKEKGQASTGAFGSSFGSLFARLTGSKTLTEEDLKPVLESMKQHLMKKNVAKEIAEKVCEGAGESLVGQKVGSFQSALMTLLPPELMRPMTSQPRMPRSALLWQHLSHASSPRRPPPTYYFPSVRNFPRRFLPLNKGCHIASLLSVSTALERAQTCPRSAFGSFKTV